MRAVPKLDIKGVSYGVRGRKVGTNGGKKKHKRAPVSSMGTSRAVLLGLRNKRL